MNILIVGNGFDLAHGLPTTYSDFLGFIGYFETIYNAKFETINNLKKADNFKKLNDRVQEYLLSERVKNKEEKLIKEIYNLSSKNIWIKHLKKCSENNKLKGKNWIDFECEISEVIKSLECLKNINIDTLKQGSVQQLDDTMYSKACDFLSKMEETYKSKEENNLNFDCNDFYGYDAKKIIDELNDELNKLIRCLEIYLEDIVGKIVIQKEKELIDIHEINKIDKLISFNYTDTFERVYDQNQEIEYDYIHGKLDISRDIEDNNMVLGIDEYLKEDDKDKKLDFIQFKKYFQRIYKKTGCRYKNWLHKAKEDQSSTMGWNVQMNNYFKNNIYIYGHSLDITDKDVLKEFIMFPKTQTTIFYYDKSDYAQKIANMVRLIGQDILIESVYGTNPRIVFKEIQKIYN